MGNNKNLAIVLIAVIVVVAFFLLKSSGVGLFSTIAINRDCSYWLDGEQTKGYILAPVTVNSTNFDWLASGKYPRCVRSIGKGVSATGSCSINYISGKTCAEAIECTEGQKQYYTCANGAKVVSCTCSSGFWSCLSVPSRECPTIPDEDENPCTLDDKVCVSSTTYRKCLTSGAWSGILLCSTGNTCSNGICGSEDDNGNGELAVCGNGVIEGEEKCDDGNTSSGDGCSSTCVKDDLWNKYKLYIIGAILLIGAFLIMKKK